MKSSQEIEKRLASGDISILADIYEEYFSLIKIIINRIVNDDEVARDLTHDVFVKAADEVIAGKYKPRGYHKSWMIRIGRNLALDHLRRSKKKMMIRDRDDFSPTELIPDDSISWLEEQSDRDIESFLVLLVSSLSKKQSEVIRLRYFKGLKFREISRLTGENETTLRGTARRAIFSIREIIKNNPGMLSGYKKGRGEPKIKTILRKRFDPS